MRRAKARPPLPGMRALVDPLAELAACAVLGEPPPREWRARHAPQGLIADLWRASESDLYLSTILRVAGGRYARFADLRDPACGRRCEKPGQCRRCAAFIRAACPVPPTVDEVFP